MYTCTLVQASPNYRRIQASVGHRHISEIVRQPGLALTIAFFVAFVRWRRGDSDASARIGSKIIETLYDSTMVKNESEIQTGTHPRYRINCLFGVCCFCSSTVSTSGKRASGCAADLRHLSQFSEGNKSAADPSRVDEGRQ